MKRSSAVIDRKTLRTAILTSITCFTFMAILYVGLDNSSAGYDSKKASVWKAPLGGATKSILGSVKRCSSLRSGAACWGDSRVWGVHEGQSVHCLLHKGPPQAHQYPELRPEPRCIGFINILSKDCSISLLLTDAIGDRVYCEQLENPATLGPSMITVHQQQCYPPRYFQAVPAAAALLNGYRIDIRPGSTDALVMQQFFCDEHFLYTTFLGPYLPKDRPITVVDAGANIGLASILYSQVINFNGEVLAIEANPSTLQILTRNLAAFNSTATPVGVALVTEDVAASGGTVNFAAEQNQFWGFKVVEDNEINANMTVHKVPTRSLSQIRDMTSSGRIDFIKIDIEGQEMHIFNDKKSWPSLCQIRCMAAEVHEWIVKGPMAALENFLENGCEDDPFQHIASTGEYTLYCRPSLLLES